MEEEKRKGMKKILIILFFVAGCGYFDNTDYCCAGSGYTKYIGTDNEEYTSVDSFCAHKTYKTKIGCERECKDETIEMFGSSPSDESLGNAVLHQDCIEYSP
tara:strand:- start:347 stop:652 length:306 start_codon:yes stop_codon:yes gene_type:complete